MLQSMELVFIDRMTTTTSSCRRPRPRRKLESLKGVVTASSAALLHSPVHARHHSAYGPQMSGPMSDCQPSDLSAEDLEAIQNLSSFKARRPEARLYDFAFYSAGLRAVPMAIDCFIAPQESR